MDKTIASAQAAGSDVPDSGLVFQWGREVSQGHMCDFVQDCDTSPYTTEDVGLPAATLGHNDLMEYFATNFGFDANETVAVMGAHTLGRAKTENSGFNGPWVKGEERIFDNNYYKVTTCNIKILSNYPSTAETV